MTAAFGPHSLGILLVHDLPPRFPALRSRLLSHSSHLAHLPAEKRERLTNERAKYLVGWSHGKETLRPGVVDRGKGSFYLNCGFYRAGNGHEDEKKKKNEDEASDENPAHNKWKDLEEYTAPNIWPDEEDIPGFRACAEELITMIIDVAVLVARACDRYAIEAVDGYQAGYLERVVKTSKTTKARLLHYFPTEDADSSSGNGNGNRNVDSSAQNAKTDDNDNDDWCATHLDHGCLTGLTSAMWTDESQSPSPSQSPPHLLPELPPPTTATTTPSSPTPAAPGLYIHTRTHQKAHIQIPRHSLAFQTGEALERITEGRFRAVPHFVRGAQAAAELAGGGRRRIARNTLAVFTQPNLDEVVDRREEGSGGGGLTFGEFARGVVGRNTTQ